MKLATPQLIQTVREDLSFLINDWPKGEVSDAELRRSSALLRRLFIYDDLILVWVTVMGKVPFIVPNDYIEVLDHERLGEVDFVSVSPAQSSPGLHISQVHVSNTLDEGQGLPYSIKSEHAKLKRFLTRDCCIINGHPIERQELITYVAVKLGGAHYDDSRRPDEEKLRAMEEYTVGSRPALLHEMLACGQALSRSDSARALLSRLDGELS